MAKAFVTGAAGFIGSTLVDRLLARGDAVVAWDNLSTGLPEFLEGARKSERFRFAQGDTLDRDGMAAAMAGCDTVYHLAANADVRFGTHHPEKDLQQNTIATFNVLEAMRANGVKRIAFPSTGSVYGEHATIPTPEDAAFPVQTSLYAASKLAGEGLISAYCEGFGFQGWGAARVVVNSPQASPRSEFQVTKRWPPGPWLADLVCSENANSESLHSMQIG